jgi:hypothetical protein
MPSGAGVAVQLTQEQQQHAFGGLGVARPLRRTSAASGGVLRKASPPGMPSALIPSPAAVAPGTMALMPTGSFALQHTSSGAAAAYSSAGGAQRLSAAGSQTDTPAAAVTLGTQYQTLATYGSAGGKTSSLLPAPPAITPPTGYTPGLGTSSGTSPGQGYQQAYGTAPGAAGVQMFSPTTAAASGSAGGAAGGSGAGAVQAGGAWDPSQGYSTMQPWAWQQQQQQAGMAVPGAPGCSFVMPDEQMLAAYAAAAPPLNFAEARRSPHGRPACCFVVLGVGGRCVLQQPSLHAGVLAGGLQGL